MTVDIDRLGKGNPPQGVKISPQIYVDLKNDASGQKNLKFQENPENSHP